MRGALAMVAAGSLLSLGGCRIQEVTVPLGRPVLVVQGVLTLDSSTAAQYIVVERSLTGTVVAPDQDSLRGPPRPPLPVSGARVVVRRDDGDSVVYSEIPDTLGVYRLPRSASPQFVQAGRVYTMRVETPAGEVVTGRTRVPATPVVTGLRPEGAMFNRDRDTLFIGWSGSPTSKGVMVHVRPRDLMRRLTLLFFTDSTSFRIAGRTPLPFVDDNRPPSVWIAGTRQTISVAATDTNLVEFTRTGNDPFTGAGFANGVAGGLGVFGSVAPVNRTYDVVGDVDHPFEGRYRLSGNFGAQPLGGDLRLFVTREAPEPLLVSALVDQPTGILAPRAEASGSIQNGRIRLTLMRDPPGQGADLNRYLMSGTFNANGTTVGSFVDSDGRVVGSFSLHRLP